MIMPSCVDFMHVVAHTLYLVDSQYQLGSEVRLVGQSSVDSFNSLENNSPNSKTNINLFEAHFNDITKISVKDKMRYLLVACFTLPSLCYC